MAFGPLVIQAPITLTWYQSRRVSPLAAAAAARLGISPPRPVAAAASSLLPCPSTSRPASCSRAPAVTILPHPTTCSRARILLLTCGPTAAFHFIAASRSRPDHAAVQPPASAASRPPPSASSLRRRRPPPASDAALRSSSPAGRPGDRSIDRSICFSDRLDLFLLLGSARLVGSARADSSARLGLLSLCSVLFP